MEIQHRIYLFGNGCDQIGRFYRFLCLNGIHAIHDRDGDAGSAVARIDEGCGQFSAVFVHLPDPAGYEMIHLIRQRFPEMPLVVLAMDQDGLQVMQKTGADWIAGFLDLEAPDEEWLSALQSIYHKWFVVSYKWMMRYMHHSASPVEKPEQNASIDAILPGVENRQLLTRQETRVVELINQGLTNQQIAESLTVNLCTVKTHVHRILAKLNVSSRSKVVVWSKNSSPKVNLPVKE